MRTPSLVLLTALASFLDPLSAQSLKKVAAIDLPGPKGQRFDYLTIDEEHQYLLSAHLGPGIVYVIDLRTNRLVKAIPGVPGITGLEYVPGLQKIYTSNWGENKIGVVDLRSMTVVKRCPPRTSPTEASMRPLSRKCTSPIPMAGRWPSLMSRRTRSEDASVQQ